MPDIDPQLTDVHAVVVSSCPQLARQLAALHPAIATVLLTRLAGIGTLRDRDALLVLTHRDPADSAHPTHRSTDRVLVRRRPVTRR